MGFFDRFRKETRAAEVAINDDELYKLLISPDALTKEKALNIPVVASCVSFISGTLAMLPIKLYKESDGRDKTEEVTDDPRLKLLNDETGDQLDAYQAKKALIRDYLLDGCGFIYINREKNNIQSLHYVDTKYISIQQGTDPIFKDARVIVNGTAYQPYDFIILARNTTDGVTGNGIINENREMLSVLYNMIVFEREILKHGGNKKGFLESEHWIDEGGMATLRQKWNELYSSAGGGVMILNDGLKFVEASTTSTELQLNENKRTNNEQACGLFNLSNDVICGKASAEQYNTAVKLAVLPILSEIQTALNKALLLESEKDSLYFVLDSTELLRASLAERYEAYSVGLNGNFLQPDEVRYMEDLPPLGLDFIKLGLNDVLYDVKNKTVYTPNTNQTAKMDGKMLTSDSEGGILKSEKRALGKVVAVDFDNTLAITRYPEIIAPIPHNIELVRQLKAEGAEIILWTCREGKALSDALVWCGQQGVPIDYVNENAPGIIEKYGNNCRKIAADIYIDDRNYAEDRAHWIKGDHGYFAGSVSEGGGSAGENKSVDKSAESGIIGVGSDEVATDTIKLQLNLFDKSDPLYIDTFSIEEEEGFEDICSHGSPMSIQIIVDGKRKNMSAAEFSAYLNESEDYKGGNIRLASCSTGKGENSFAQQLSKELGVTVKAPDNDVYYVPDEGVLYVGSPYTNTGKWRTFKNGDEII